MSLFKNQPGFCAVCGMKDDYKWERNRPILCSNQCWLEYEWRITLYIMGKPYYPKPQDAHTQRS